MVKTDDDDGDDNGDDNALIACVLIISTSSLCLSFLRYSKATITDRR